MESKIKLFISLGAFFLFFIINTSGVKAATYSGTYTNGLTVSGNGDIVDGADVSNSSGGICLNITGDNVTVRNTKIHDCQDHGVRFLGTNGGLIENSEIWHAAMRVKPNTAGSGWPSLLKVQSIDESSTGLAHNIIIRNNYIHEGYGECMGLRGSNLTVTGNNVKDCYSIGIYSNSDHVTIENNTVTCTGNPEFNRDGLPMAGIASAEESFSGWGAHGHDTQIVQHNSVTGCKYGYRYGSSVNNLGLINSIIAFNNFFNIKTAAVSITHYPNESNNQFHDNISGIGPVPTPTSPPTPRPPTPNPTPAKTGDVNGDGRVDIIDIGIIIDNYGRSPIVNAKADINHDGVVDIVDIGISIDNYEK